MRIDRMDLEGPALVHSAPIEDARGFFARLFCADALAPWLAGKRIVNANLSRTDTAGMVRGLHYQTPPMTETKCVRCLQGAIYDVIVDVRAGSATFLQWRGVELRADAMNMLIVPDGFAHGFQALEDGATVLYLTTRAYAPDHEAGLNAIDPALGIDWPLPVGVRSDKDRACAFLDPAFGGIVLDGSEPSVDLA